jgi:hypothetical protein
MSRCFENDLDEPLARPSRRERLTHLILYVALLA